MLKIYFDIKDLKNVEWSNKISCNTLLIKIQVFIYLIMWRSKLILQKLNRKQNENSYCFSIINQSWESDLTIQYRHWFDWQYNEHNTTSLTWLPHDIDTVIIGDDDECTGGGGEYLLPVLLRGRTPLTWYVLVRGRGGTFAYTTEGASHLGGKGEGIRHQTVCCDRSLVQCSIVLVMDRWNYTCPLAPSPKPLM